MLILRESLLVKDLSRFSTDSKYTYELHFCADVDSKPYKLQQRQQCRSFPKIEYITRSPPKILLRFARCLDAGRRDERAVWVEPVLPQHCP